MNDPIKDFVEQHREDFDHLEAPRFNLAGFKAKQAREPVRKKYRALTIKPVQWMSAAAAVLLFSVMGFWFFSSTDQANDPVQHVGVKKDNTRQESNLKPDVKVFTKVRQPVQLARQEVLPVKKRFKKAVQPVDQFDPMLEQQLSDSTSSSTRLAAVLTIKRSDFISYDLLDRLGGTIQHDRNSNVRLAALSILEKYQQDAHVANLLVTALNHQNDPMVQLSLVNLLGKMQNVVIDEQLYALVNDPSTMEAVKDEAYQILLKENKF